MDIPVRHHTNNAYGAARQAEHEAERQTNLNIYRAIRSVRKAMECVRRCDNPISATASMQSAINSLEKELERRK